MTAKCVMHGGSFSRTDRPMARRRFPFPFDRWRSIIPLNFSYVLSFWISPHRAAPQSTRRSRGAAISNVRVPTSCSKRSCVVPEISRFHLTDRYSQHSPCLEGFVQDFIMGLCILDSSKNFIRAQILNRDSWPNSYSVTRYGNHN